MGGNACQGVGFLTRPPLPPMVAAAHRRTRWALVAVLAGLGLAVLTSGGVFLAGSPAAATVLTLIGVLGLAVVALAVLLLVRWVNERSADLHLALSTSEAVLWRYYPADDRVEFVAGDPATIGVGATPVQGLEALRQLTDREDREAGVTALRRALVDGNPFSYTYRAMLPSRGARRIAVRALPLRDERGRSVVLGVSWDETETRAAADRAERTSRLHATLGALNRATRAAASLEHLYRQVCQAVADVGAFPLVWIGEVEDGRARPVAAVGPAAGVPETADGAGTGPVAQALRQGSLAWSNQLDEAAEAQGLKSAVVIPFRRPGAAGAMGVLALYAAEPGFFSPAEGVLLGRFGDDLARAAERLLAREEQRRQRELLSTLIASAPVPIVALDLAGRVSEIWNAAAEQAFGWRREEVLGQPLPFVPSEELSDARALIDRVLAGDVLRGVPVRRRRRDGGALEMLLAAAPLHDVRGRVTGILGVMMDQTERIEAEARFRRISEQAPDVIYRYRLLPWPGIEYVNPAVQAVLGYTPQELYDMPDAIGLILHPDETRRFQQMIARPEAMESERLEMRWRHRDGTTVWVEHRGVLLRDAAGQVVAVEGIARDVTARRRDLEELAQHSRVVEQTSESVMVTEPNGTLVYVNPAFEHLTGWSRAEVLGRTPRLLNSGEQPAEFYAELWARITRGETWSGQIVNRRKDGSTYVADMVVSPVRDAGGRIANYVAMQRDITHQRNLEEQLRQSQKMEALGQLTGGIAHDFNNLLTIILSNASLLADAVADQPGLARDVQAIRTAAGRGARVVRQLMQFGRRERLEPVAMDLGAQIEELAATFRRLLPENITVELMVSPHLPPARADATAVEQMMLNVATNARDAMPDGGELRIGVTAEPDDDGARAWVVVAVRDTGIGMSREVVARVFEPFYTTKPAGKGTGLGLAMVYGLVEQQGGRVTIYSEPGLGTTLRLYFPIAAEDDALAAAEGALAVPPRGAGQLVLLVEDEDALRDVGARLLGALGYRVETAPDGQSALARLAGNGPMPDVLVTDVVMPGMTGPQLLATVRERGIRVPVLFATGYAAREVLQSLGETDALIVEKPWTLDELGRKVQEALRRG